MENDWTPPSKTNLFRAGDEVVFRNRGMVPSFKVHHVEAGMVFIESKTLGGKKKIVDYPASEFILVPEYKRIYHGQ